MKLRQSVSMIIISIVAIACTSCLNSPGQAGNVILVSSNQQGEVGNRESLNSSISADGRYVVFQSIADNLGSHHDERRSDIFRKELETGEIVLCSASSTAEEGNGDSENPCISLDGRYIAFESTSTNLVSGDNNGHGDIFRKDMVTGEIIRCSTGSENQEANGESRKPAISADGRYVAFYSIANNLVPDANASFRRDNVFLKDCDTGKVTCCSSSSTGEIANMESLDPAISPDGRYIVFASSATNLIPNDTKGQQEIFRKDIQTNEIILVSSNGENEQANQDSIEPAISGDGRYILFASRANNLTSASKDTRNDAVYRKDLETGEIVCCSTSKNGEIGNGNSESGQISLDGKFVVFDSDAPNLAKGSNRKTHIYLKDLETGNISICSTTKDGDLENEDSRFPSISADGKSMTFESESTNLAPLRPKTDVSIYNIFCKEIP